MLDITIKSNPLQFYWRDVTTSHAFLHFSAVHISAFAFSHPQCLARFRVAHPTSSLHVHYIYTHKKHPPQEYALVILSLFTLSIIRNNQLLAKSKGRRAFSQLFKIQSTHHIPWTLFTNALSSWEIIFNKTPIHFQLIVSSLPLIPRHTRFLFEHSSLWFLYFLPFVLVLSCSSLSYVYQSPKLDIQSPFFY